MEELSFKIARMRGLRDEVTADSQSGVPEALFKPAAYTVDLPEVVAGPPCSGGLGVTGLRHFGAPALAVPRLNRPR